MDSVSCVTCSKTFWGDEYKTHCQCIIRFWMKQVRNPWVTSSLPSLLHQLLLPQQGAGVLLILIGVFIRGPGWLWFWPGMTWDPQL